jgi:hypothetical protein
MDSERLGGNIIGPLFVDNCLVVVVSYCLMQIQRDM